MLHTKFQGHWSVGSEEEDFLWFLHIWAWRPSGHVTQLIWFQIAQLFLRKTSLNFEI